MKKILEDSKSKKYWFKRKRFGWGWIPTTWQGWLVIVVWLIFILYLSKLFEAGKNSTAETEMAIIFVSLVFLSVIPLVLIACLRGPKPKWRWGKSKKDDPDLDF